MPEIDFDKIIEYFKNPKNRNYVYAFLGLSGLASLYTYLSMEEEITYTDFLKTYLEGNQVA
jgi:AFG3 family protein